MKGFLSRFSGKKDYDEEYDDYEEDYLELDTASNDGRGPRMIIKPFKVEEFKDAKEIIKVYRQGNVICFVDIKPLKQQDMIELKRLINKVKKTVNAMSGEIAGIGRDHVVLAPSHANIHMSPESEHIE